MWMTHIYNGGINGGCDICQKEFDWNANFYECSEPECLIRGYHECTTPCHTKSKHIHKDLMTKYPFKNGTLVTFKRTCISENTKLVKKCSTNYRNL